MTQEIANSLSVRDGRLIELYQLGTPIAIYRIGRSRTLIMGCLGVLFIVLGFCLIVVFFFIQPISLQTAFEDFIIGRFASLLLLLAGLYVLFIEVPGMWKERVIVCEHGLLLFRLFHVEVLHWKEVSTIKLKYPSNGYSIICSGNKIIPLPGYYQNMQQLVTLLWQHSRGK